MPKPIMVIFDFDGTVADTITPGLKVANEMLIEMGKKPITLAEFHELRKLSIHEALQKFELTMIQVPILALKMQKRMRGNMENVKPFPRIGKILATLLEREYKLEMLTTNARDIVEPFLVKHSLNLFAEITAEKNLFGKAASMKKILKRNKLTPDQVIYIGDEVRDIEASKKAGIPVISVTWGLQSREALEKAGADYLADRPEDILTILP